MTLLLIYDVYCHNSRKVRNCKFGVSYNSVIENLLYKVMLDEEKIKLWYDSICTSRQDEHLF